MSGDDRSKTFFQRVFLSIGIAFLAAAAILLVIRPFAGETAAFVLLILAIDFGVIGLIFTIIGGVYAAKARGERDKADRLMSIGKMYACEFIRAKINPYVQVNRVRPIAVECAYTDEYGKRHLIKSGNLYLDYLASPLSDAAITAWVNPNDPRDYYVDVSFSGAEGARGDIDYDDR